MINDRPRVVARPEDIHDVVGFDWRLHPSLYIVPYDNLNAIKELRNRNDPRGWFRIEQLWNGSGWKMWLGLLKLNLHLAWHYLRGDEATSWRFLLSRKGVGHKSFGGNLRPENRETRPRWGHFPFCLGVTPPDKTKYNPIVHSGTWYYDDTQRVSSVACQCGTVFAQRPPIWLYPRYEYDIEENKQ